MDKQAVKHSLYGGLTELITDKKYYYASSMGAEYSHFTPAGEEAVAELVKLFAWNILQAHNAELDARAKQQVLSALKGQE